MMIKTLIAQTETHKELEELDIFELIEEYDGEDFEEGTDLLDILNYSGYVNEIIDSMIDDSYSCLRKWAVDNISYISKAEDNGLMEGLKERCDSYEEMFYAMIQMGQYEFYQGEVYREIDEAQAILNEALERQEELEAERLAERLADESDMLMSETFR